MRILWLGVGTLSSALCLIAIGSDDWQASLQRGRVASREGKLDEAERIYRFALQQVEQTGAPGDIGNVLTDLGMVLRDQGRYETADLALALFEAGDEPINVAAGLNNLASNRQSTGRVKEAEAVYLQALAVWEQVDPGAKGALVTESNLASIASGVETTRAQNCCC